MFKVGDKVWVRSWEEIFDLTNCRKSAEGDEMYYLKTGDATGFNGKMDEFCGAPAIVTSCSEGSDGRPYYLLSALVSDNLGLDFGAWTWRDWMLTDADPEESYDDDDDDDCEEDSEDDEDFSSQSRIEPYFAEATNKFAYGEAQKKLDSREPWTLKGFTWRHACPCPMCRAITALLEKRARIDEARSRLVETIELVKETKKAEEVKKNKSAYVLFHNGDFHGFIYLTEQEVVAIGRVLDAIDTETELLPIEEAIEGYIL